MGLVPSLKSLKKMGPIPYGTPYNKPSLLPHHPTEETYLILAELPPKGKKRKNCPVREKGVQVGALETMTGCGSHGSPSPPKSN